MLAGAAFLALLNSQAAGRGPAALAKAWRACARVQDHVTLLLAAAAAAGAALVALLAWAATAPRRVFVVDFAVFRPRESEAVGTCSTDTTKRQVRAPGTPFTPETADFISKVLDISGVGPCTAWPANMLGPPTQWGYQLADAKAESEEVMFTVVADALAAARLRPGDVDILVVNCSIFCPTPSLSAMIVNKFKMKHVTAYSLGGMGCSAGLIAVDLARELLASRPAGQTALVVSTENISVATYHGADRSMLVPLALFRVGGSAVVLTNAGPLSPLRRRAKYELTHLVRTHRGADDRAFACVNQAADADGRIGVRLSRELVAVAGDALTANITRLAPLVLPFGEQARFVARAAARAAAKALGRAAPKPYVPDFTTAFDHFCVHPGGKTVLESVAKSLRLSPEAIRPSVGTLWRHGNTSSSSIWYVLAWIESGPAVVAKQAAAKAGGLPGLTVPWAPSAAGLAPPQPVRKGDRVWQIAFGSGFKCNSAVLRARRHICQLHAAYDDFEF